MISSMLAQYIGHRVRFEIDDPQVDEMDATECFGLLNAIQGDQAVWGESLGLRWIPVAQISAVELER